jgi:hypothetical protein
MPGDPRPIERLRVPGTDTRGAVPANQTLSGLTGDEKTDRRQEDHHKEQHA